MRRELLSLTAPLAAASLCAVALSTGAVSAQETVGGEGGDGPAPAVEGVRADEGDAYERVQTVKLQTADGESAGTVVLTETDNGVLVSARLYGLPEGPHGFHLHETGTCEGPDFQSAGGHFAPEGNEHGFATEAGYHAGDLPNVIIDNNMRGRAEAFTAAVTLTPSAGAAAAEQERPSLRDEDGSAIIVHASGDNYIDTDSAGARIACGVIPASE